jgi:equilibrative nucleoside transporter 1/2/3
VFITFAVTLVVFPSVTSSICSASNPATAPPCVARPPGAGIASRLSGDLFAPTMFLLANACDFFGRRAAGAGTGGAGLKSPPRGWVLVVLSIARIALIPPLLMCNVVVEGSWGVRRALAGSDVWPVALVAAMSFTNGHLGSTCMMYGPSFVAPGKRGEEGAKLSLAVIGGLATGSVLSFALTAWLQS